MNRISIFICIVFFDWITFSEAAPASDPAAPLSLKTVLYSAMEQFPGLRAQRAVLDSIEAKVLGNAGVFDPLFQGSYDDKAGFYNRRFKNFSLIQNTPFWGLKLKTSFRRSDGNLPIYELGQETLSRGEWLGGFELPILQGGLTDEKRAKFYASQSEAKAARFTFQNGEIEILRNANHLYWDWVHAGFRYRIQKSLLDLARDRDRQLQIRVTHGDLPAIELDENRRAILQRETQLLSAKRALQKAALELSLVYRDPNGNKILPLIEQLPDEIKSPTELVEAEKTEPKDIEKAVSNHPQTQSLKFQEEKTKYELQWARQQILPKLDLKWSVSQDRGTGPTPLSQREYSVGVLFEMPLFLRPGRGALQSSRADLSRIQNQQQLISDQIQIRIQDTHQNLLNIYQQISLIHNEVLMAQKVENAERIRFQKGDSSLLLVNLREQMTADAKIREVQAQTELWKAWVDYKTARGERFWESL